MFVGPTAMEFGNKNEALKKILQDVASASAASTGLWRPLRDSFQLTSE